MSHLDTIAVRKVLAAAAAAAEVRSAACWKLSHWGGSQRLLDQGWTWVDAGRHLAWGKVSNSTIRLVFA